MLEFTVFSASLISIFASTGAFIKIGRAAKNQNLGDLSKVSSSALPSIAVCIPARNEDHALTDCLQAVLASDYEKLEIIVLDDNSVDNTSVLIKSFAHAGVRFIEGSPLPDGWLGKNYALSNLLKEASGSYVLFMDVDTRISPDTISQLAKYIVKEQLDMVSVIPARTDGFRFSVISSPLRYFWEIIFNSKSSPASAANAWIALKSKLVDHGGFDAVKDNAKPELHFAAFFSARDDYKYLLGGGKLGLFYEKKWLSQLSTSIRLLSPRLNDSFALSLLSASILMLIAVLPVFAVVLWSTWAGVVALLASMFTSFIYARYAKLVWKTAWPLAMIVWPFILVQEATLILVSYVMHRSGKVTWKGRPLRQEAQS